jgi:hypothetical protein
MLQHEQDDLSRSKEMVLLQKVLTVIKDNFSDAHNQMKGRSQSDQTIIGGTLTSLEIEIKKEIKELPIY